MHAPRSKVLCQTRPSKEDVRDALASDWSKCFPPSYHRTAAAVMDCSAGTVANGASGKHIPELDTVLSSLLVNPAALSTVLALYGVKAVPLLADAANDLHTVSSISHLAGQWIGALSDGSRDHQETLTLADAIRTILPALSAIVAEADRIRGIAA